MKTSIKSLIAIVLTTLTISTASANDKVTVLSEIKNINKINVSGNVELIIVQSNNEGVQVYNDYFNNNALVQAKNGVLNISSFNKEQLTVVVSAKQLSSINASDDAVVSSFGNLSFLTLDVKLQDNAKADLKVTTAALNTQVKEDAKLTLAGTTFDHKANFANIAKVNLNNFASEATTFKTNNIRIASNGGLEEINTIQLGK